MLELSFFSDKLLVIWNGFHLHETITNILYISVYFNVKYKDLYPISLEKQVKLDF